MNINAKRLIGLIIIMACAVHGKVEAQYITKSTTTGYSTPQDFEFQSDGTVIAIAAYNASAQMMSSPGQSTKLMWYPSFAAFRAGKVDGTAYTVSLPTTPTATMATLTGVEWDNTSANQNIGIFSVAMGADTVARGSYSTAFGTRSTAWGSSSFADGVLCFAYGASSVAFGDTSTADGDYSVAMGHITAASGSNSLALGTAATAAGSYSTAIGHYAVANGGGSVAFGTTTHADSYLSTVFGTYNVGGAGTNGSTTWLTTDPLFEIGNGTSSTAQTDALLILKNGNTTISGIDNELPNQTLVGSHSILTESLGDARYLSTSPANITATGSISSASLTASGAFSTATLASSGNATISGTNNTLPNQTLTGSTSILTEGLGDGRYMSASPTSITATGTVTAASLVSSGNATISGTDNELPNQTLVGSQSILTEALGDGRYLPTSPTTITATGAVSAGSLTTAGAVNSATVTATGAVSAASLTTTGSITTAGVASSGTITAAPSGDIPMFTGY